MDEKHIPEICLPKSHVLVLGGGPSEFKHSRVGLVELKVTKRTRGDVVSPHVGGYAERMIGGKPA